MKPKHIILVIALVIVVGIGFVVYRVIGSMDEIVKVAIEKAGSEVMQVDVSLDKVNIDLSNGQVALLGLNVGNPEGFNTDHLLALDEIKVTVDINSISKDPIIIKEILVQKPSIIYEMASGGSNIDTLVKNIENYTGSQTKSESSDEGKKLVIEDVYINDGQVNLSHTALAGKTMSAGLPDLHLEDIGKEEGGASPGEVAGEIMSEIKAGATSAVGSIKNLPGAVAEQLQGILGEDTVNKVKDVGESVKSKLGEAGDKLKGLFD